MLSRNSGPSSHVDMWKGILYLATLGPAILIIIGLLKAKRKLL